ncbi:site-2 protease family protein [soil metagenome]
MLAMPAPTPYDVKFRLLGIPVRVHPLFWLIVALLGGLGRQGVEPTQVLIWVGCVFVSILVHEYGHGLTAGAFGYRSTIALHGFGGLCASEGERQTPVERLAVLFMGPGAGFLLFGLTLAVAYVAYGVTPQEALGLGLAGQFGWAETMRSGGLKFPSEFVLYLFFYLFQINLFWGLINLLPIWPLDGGRIAGVFFEMADGRQGMRKAHTLSLVTAGVLAVVAAVQFERWFIALFMAYFAFMNYQILQTMRSSGYGYGDDIDLWRR